MKTDEPTPLEKAEAQLKRIALQYHRLVQPRPPARPLPADHPDVVFYSKLVKSAEKNVARMRTNGR